MVNYDKAYSMMHVAEASRIGGSVLKKPMMGVVDCDKSYNMIPTSESATGKEVIMNKL